MTTFSDPLANALRTGLKRLLGNEPRLAERIDVYSINAIGLRLYRAHVGQATIASREIVRQILALAAGAVSDHKFGRHFLFTEWDQVVDAWQLTNWEAYRDVARLGRKTRLPEAQRRVLWSIFEHVRLELQARKLITFAELFSSLAAVIAKNNKPIFDYAVVDEAQDISPRPPPVLCCLGRGQTERPLFRGRPRAAHIPATILLEGPRRGHPWPLAHLARELSYLASNPHAGRPLARPDRDRRGREYRGPKRHCFRVQWSAADDLLVQE